jgi:hypothetical protein
MQYEYEIKIDGKDRPSTWYRDNARNILGSDVDASLFNTLRVKVVHKEGNPREELRKVVVASVTFMWNDMGSATKEDEETKPSSEQETLPSPSPHQQPIQPSITNNPDAQDLRLWEYFGLSIAIGGSIAVGWKGYVAFALEWSDNGRGNRTIYAATFVDDHGNQKVLHIWDDKVCD